MDLKTVRPELVEGWTGMACSWFDKLTTNGDICIFLGRIKGLNIQINHIAAISLLVYYYIKHVDKVGKNGR